MDDHQVPLQQLLARLRTDRLHGLKGGEAAQRLEANGPNRLTPPPQKSKLRKFFGQLLGGFALLLWIGAFLSILGWLLDRTLDEYVSNQTVDGMLMLLAAVPRRDVDRGGDGDWRVFILPRSQVGLHHGR